jgi:hypothetical protein
MARAMTLAGDKLLIAGSSDLLDEDAAMRGERGGVFQAIDAETGEPLIELPLDSPPVFDGMSVFGGRAYIATMNGRIVCLGE